MSMDESRRIMNVIMKYEPVYLQLETFNRSISNLDLLNHYAYDWTIIQYQQTCGKLNISGRIHTCHECHNEVQTSISTTRYYQSINIEQGFSYHHAYNWTWIQYQTTCGKKLINIGGRIHT